MTWHSSNSLSAQIARPGQTNGVIYFHEFDKVKH